VASSLTPGVASGEIADEKNDRKAENEKRDRQERRKFEISAREGNPG
jgi:hypothetical protein